MKLLFIISLIFSNTLLFSQTKRALVIAIGEYAPNYGKGWKKISSINDTAYILPVLREQGFKIPNTTVLTNQQATIEGIRLALTKLKENSNPDDIIYIHVSSHGAQIEDDNKDEIDGFDESIVTYNAILPKYSLDYEKDKLNYLRDDEFGESIEQIRLKLGVKGDVIVILDNCHSGSGTRNIGNIVRGGQIPLTSKKTETNLKTKDASVFKEKSAKSSNLASCVIISAARAEELNTELKINDKGVGSLTYATAKAFEIHNPSLTYRGFFSQIQTTMNELVPQQHPVIEGDGIDRELLGGNFLVQPEFIEVKSIDDAKAITVQAGTIAGLTKGSIVAIYPSGTTDTISTRVSALGTVTWSDNFKSGIELTSPLSQEKPGAYWVFIKSTHFPMRPIVLSINGAVKLKSTVTEIDKARTILKTNKLVVLVGTPDLILHIGEKQDSLIDCVSGYKWETFEKNVDNTELLNASIKRYVQYSFLKSYTVQDKNFLVSIKLIPCANGKPDTTLIPSKNIIGTNEFKKGDTFVMSISNQSNRKVYFNIIDLQPDGIINPIMPNKAEKIRSEELFIDANSTKVFESFPITISPPYGDEVFKVFLSKDKLDLEYITQTREKGTRSFLTDLERVFKSSYTPTSRGEFGAKEGSVLNVNFRIVE